MVLIIFGLPLLSAHAQISPEQIRNTDTITYFVNNPYGNQAEFTWIITGGIIIGHSSPYTADGADTIRVLWDDANRTSANPGSLLVSEIVKWPDGSSCPSDVEQIDIESWVQPAALTDTSGIIVCSGESFLIGLDFEGKPGYQYKWKLYDKDNPSVILEDHTAAFISCMYTSTDIIIPGLVNTGSAEKLYVFEVTDVQDDLPDGMPGNVSSGRVMVHVQPKTSTGTLKSNNHLIRR